MRVMHVPYWKFWKLGKYMKVYIHLSSYFSHIWMYSFLLACFYFPSICKIVIIEFCILSNTFNYIVSISMSLQKLWFQSNLHVYWTLLGTLKSIKCVPYPFGTYNLFEKKRLIYMKPTVKSKERNIIKCHFLRQTRRTVQIQRRERLIWTTLVKEGSQGRQDLSWPLQDKKRRMKKAQASWKQKHLGEAGLSNKNPFMLCCWWWYRATHGQDFRTPGAHLTHEQINPGL